MVFLCLRGNKISNNKKTSSGVASMAVKALSNPNTSAIQKNLAASAPSLTGTKNQTGKVMETVASNVLNSNKCSNETKTFAASLLAQSNRKR